MSGITRQQRRHQERMAAKGKPVASLDRGQHDYRAPLSATKSPPRTERLVSCALIDGEGKVHKGCHSHSDLRANIGRADPYTADPRDTPGYWTSNDRFVSRREGNRIAALSGQCVSMQREMLSSDVDWEAA